MSDVLYTERVANYSRIMRAGEDDGAAAKEAELKATVFLENYLNRTGELSCGEITLTSGVRTEKAPPPDQFDIARWNAQAVDVRVAYASASTWTRPATVGAEK